ncbi:acetyltransferase [Phormidium tenue FACHB-886]|nr:acetyltransferase [Phormidium tenue FACHB-886]
MLLQDKKNGTLIEITDTTELFNPVRSQVSGRDQAGQEEQDPVMYEKTALIFPSGENLPRCWIDAEYNAAK